MSGEMVKFRLELEHRDGWIHWNLYKLDGSARSRLAEGVARSIEDAQAVGQDAAEDWLHLDKYRRDVRAASMEFERARL